MSRVRSHIRGSAVFALKFAVAAGVIWLLAATNADVLREAFRSFDRRFSRLHWRFTSCTCW